MTKFEVSGTGAAAWLDGILANHLPKIGRVNLAYQRHLMEALLAAGKGHGLRLIGLNVLESLRLDKSYRA